MKKIFKIKTETLIDEFPTDTSYIGEYTDYAGDWVIDRRHGEFVSILEKNDPNYELPERGREYRFFKPYAGGEKEGSGYYLKYGKQDFERMEALNRGEWWYTGIRAEAEVGVSFDGGKSWKIDYLMSGGLWGIESDSEEKYLEEVRKEELDQLRCILLEYGFLEKQVSSVISAIGESTKQ